ncbi:MAG: VacJ family lipoprotein [Pseudomonadota bacterium]
MQRNFIKRGVIAAALLVGLSACASQGEKISTGDPWEPVNRSIYGFNNGLDRVLLKPLAKGYRFITPDPVERGVSNVFANLSTPITMVNNLLQGKPVDALSDAGRFLLNSTVGIAGIFDPATAAGLDKHSEDFGQTMAVWGVPSGPYIVLPFWGPSTVRGGVGLIPNQLLHGRNLIDDTGIRDKSFILQIIQARASLLALDGQIAASNDPYIFVREAYLQNRNFVIYDGQPPEPEDEFELEEGFDDDLDSFDDDL